MLFFLKFETKNMIEIHKNHRYIENKKKMTTKYKNINGLYSKNIIEPIRNNNS